MKKSLFLALLLAASDLYAEGETVYTLYNGDQFTYDSVISGGNELAPEYQNKSVVVTDNRTWTDNGNLTSLTGLYLTAGTGVKFNHPITDGLAVKYLHIDRSIQIDNNTNADPSYIRWNYSPKQIRVVGDGAYLDIDKDYGSYLKVNGIENGTVYLNENGYLNTANSTLASGNTVCATYSADSGHTEDAARAFSVSGQGSTTYIWNTDGAKTRTLLGGDYSGWTGTVNFSGLDEGQVYGVNTTSSGLSVTYGEVSETLSTRNGQKFPTTTLKTSTEREVTRDDLSASAYVAVASGASAWTSSTNAINGLLLGDGAGYKINHWQNVTVTYLQIGENIVFDDSTDDAAGYIRWSGGDRQFEISDTEGAWVDINTQVGTHIIVGSMNKGSVYLNTNGLIDTAGHELKASNTVYATYSEDTAGALLTTNTDVISLSEGSSKITLRLGGNTRKLLTGNYSNWAGTVEMNGFEEDAATYGNSTSLGIVWGGTEKTLTTRNGEAFNATAVKTDSSQLTTSDYTGSVVILKTSTVDCAWTNNQYKTVTALYLEDGAGVKFNHDDNVNVTYLHIGDGIVFQKAAVGNTTNVTGGINWSDADSSKAGKQYLNITGTAGAYVDINMDAGTRINVSRMSRGTVYLNTAGKINTTDALLGSGNTIHAVLATDAEDGFNFYGFDETGHLISKGAERILLQGDYSDGWTGNYVFLDADRENQLTANSYLTTATANGLGVSYLRTDDDVYTGASGKSTTCGVLCREDASISIQGVADLTFEGNTTTATGDHAGAAVIHSSGDVGIHATGAVNFSNNTATSGGNLAGAIYAGGDISISSEDTVSFTGNKGSVAGAIYAAGDNATVTLSAASADVTFSGNTIGSGADAEDNDIAFASTGTLNLAAAQDRTLTLGGGVKGGTGDVDVNVNADAQSGKVVLGGTNTYTGSTGVYGGTLEVAGSVRGTSSLSVAGSGALEVTGSGSLGIGADAVTITYNQPAAPTVFSDPAVEVTPGAVIEHATVSATGISKEAGYQGKGSITNAAIALNDIGSDTYNMSEVVFVDSTIKQLQADSHIALENVVLVGSTNLVQENVVTTGTAAISRSEVRLTSISVKQVDGIQSLELGGKTYQTMSVSTDILKGYTSVSDITLNLDWSFIDALTGTAEDQTFNAVAIDFGNSNVTAETITSLTGALADPKFNSLKWLDGPSSGLVVIAVDGANIPEPTTGALSVLALAALAARRRRGKKN